MVSMGLHTEVLSTSGTGIYILKIAQSACLWDYFQNGSLGRVWSFRNDLKIAS
jgi:hypothetical protein